MNNNIYKYLKEASISPEIFLKYKDLNKIKLKFLGIDSIVFDNRNFIVLAGADLHEDISSIPNYKEYIKNSFSEINALLAKDFNLNDDVLGPIYFDSGKFGMAIFLHKNLQPLREIQTILNIILYFLDVDYIVRFPSNILECNLEDLGISCLLFFPIPIDENDYVYILKIKAIGERILTFQVNRHTEIEDISNIDFVFDILYYLVPNIMKYTEIKPESTWLIPHNLEYYLMPKETLIDEFEMLCDYKYYKIAEFVDAATLEKRMYA